MLNNYFSKIIFLFVNLGLLTSCSQDPLSTVPKELASGFSKQSYSMPNSVKLNRFTGDSVKLTVDDSSQLIMRFKEERNSTYSLAIRSATVPDIQISKVELKGFPEELAKTDLKFDFDEKKGVGSFAWTPKSTFVKSEMYRSFSARLRITFNLPGHTKAIVDRELLVYVEKSFYTPELLGFQFGRSDDQLPHDLKSAIVYVHPFMYSKSKSGKLTLTDRITELQFRVRDRNYATNPNLEIEEISDERLFSIFKKGSSLKRKRISSAIWSLIYKFNPLELQNKDEKVNTNFETERLRAYVSSLGYKSKVQTIYFKIFPRINPEYEVLDSEIQDSQDILENHQDGVTTTINKSTVSVKDRVKIRYKIEKHFVQRYMTLFEIPLGRYQSDEREYASHEMEESEASFSDEAFFRSILSFDSRAHSTEKQSSYGEYTHPVVPCKEYTSNKNPNVSYDNITCACDKEFVFSEDTTHYYLERICSLGVDFSISPHEASKQRGDDEIHEYYLSNVLAFSEMNVFKKIFSIKGYKEEKYQEAQINYDIDKKEYTDDPKNVESYPEYVNPYQGYTDEQFYNLLKEERVAMLHSVEAGQWSKELHFIYDLGAPSINCSTINKEGFKLSCEIIYFLPESVLAKKSLDIKLDFSQKEGYQCGDVALARVKETMSKTCLIESRNFSLVSSLEPKDSRTIIVRSNTLGTVLTNEAFEFVIQNGNITQRAIKH